MKKLLAALASCLMLFAWNNPVAFTETTKEKCDRLREAGEDLPPECNGPSLPNLPDNSGGSATTEPAAPTTSTRPPHEAWESPSAGEDDSGSSKPDKPEKPEKPAQPAQSEKPEKDPKPSSSKKPSAASSADSEDSSTGGGKRPETVCGGEFCGGDTLVGGTGNANERWPGMNNPGNAGDDAAPATVTRPADENTPADQLGTIVETANGLAIETAEGLLELDPEQAKTYAAGERVQISRDRNINKDGPNAEKYEEDPYWYLREEAPERGRCQWGWQSKPLSNPNGGALSSERQAAVDYAERYAETPNEDFQYFGENGDCTNFVSQSMLAGGQEQVYPPNRSAAMMIRQGVAPDEAKTDTKFWYDPRVPDSWPGTYNSTSWSVASDNYDFMTNKSGRGTVVGYGDTSSPDAFDPLAPSKAGLEPGDLIYYRKNDTGEINHVAVYVGQIEDSQGNKIDVVDQHSVGPGCSKHAPWTPNPYGEYTGGQSSVEFVKVNY